MLFSIQYGSGEVLETLEAPGVGMSAEVLASELGAKLQGVLGRDGVRDVPLYKSETKEKVPRVVIDVDPCGNGEARIAFVHEAILSVIMPPLEEV